MTQYIDKDALVVEIDNILDYIDEHWDTDYAIGAQRFADKLQDAIDTLEVKEVDLEEETKKWWKERLHLNLENKLWMDAHQSIVFAKHFFEMGMQAQHDNWKVGDNTNLPQGDRTKIYCVFTKQRYILAKVISHPQDEDLLQWKCTEFPHHCYDMCEGDKYMQIV